MSTAMMVIRWLWPFLREMILNGKTLKESFKTAKLRVAFLLLIVVGIGVGISAGLSSIVSLNTTTPPTPEEIVAFKKLEKRISELEIGFRPADDPSPVVAEVSSASSIELVGNTPPIEIPKPVVKPPPKPKRILPPHVEPTVEKIPDRKKDYMDFFDQHSG